MKWNFPCINASHIFVVPFTGLYKLEVWGAQGGTHFTMGLGSSPQYSQYHGVGIGGYGAYSVGAYYAIKNTKLYIYVGGRGWDERRYDPDAPSKGGWNGGGASTVSWENRAYKPTGGGATDISLIYSDVSEDSSHRYSRTEESYNARIIVAGGGGAGCQQDRNVNLGQGGSGGGYIGGTGQRGYLDNKYGKGGTQSSPGEKTFSTSSLGEFGLGSGNGNSIDGSCSGGGWWGGNEGADGGAGGGSGYISGVISTASITKGMWCFNCEESDLYHIKTTSVTAFSEDPVPFTAKVGDGYATITLISTHIYTSTLHARSISFILVCLLSNNSI